MARSQLRTQFDSFDWAHTHTYTESQALAFVYIVPFIVALNKYDEAHGMCTMPSDNTLFFFLRAEINIATVQLHFTQSE